jgi:hypothetical protein
VLWLQTPGPFARFRLDIPYICEMRDGGDVLITNRVADLTSWFELRPNDDQGSLAYEMVNRVNRRWRWPPPE